MTGRPTIAFLGTGRMGLPMAANLVRAGFPVRVWNRTRDRVEPLTGAGAAATATPAAAVHAADIAITMLTDGPAVESLLTGPGGFLDNAPAHLIWIQMGTLGLDWTDRLATTARQHGTRFVDAPVAGSEGPARAGQLLVLASGPEDTRASVQPVFDVLGDKTVWLGSAGLGTRAKLALNAWLVDLTETTAETLRFAESMGLDPAVIIDILDATPLAAPYAVQKARTMITGDFRPAFALKHAIKDAALAADAAHATHTQLTLVDALLPTWQHVAAGGHGDDDLSVVYTANTPSRSTT